MAIDLMVGYKNDAASSLSLSSPMEDTQAHTIAQEASKGLQSVHNFINLLSKSTENPHPTAATSPATMDIDLNCRAVADDAVSRFKNVISLLGRARTGHARFRRAPVSSPLSPPKRSGDVVVLCPKPIQQVPPAHPGFDFKPAAVINFAYSSPVVSSAGNSVKSTLTGETDSKQNTTATAATTTTTTSFQISNYSGMSAAGKPPLSHTTSFKVRKCHSENGKCGGGSSDRCHCSKKRKLRLKRVVRVPAISSKMADVPPDDYSWRKYGQKPIKGSPHPRGYYKCSTVRGCPARKHVERALDDANMLIVTYEGEHNHSLSIAEASILESS